jgi:cysteine-rich repeat protein
MKVFLNAKPLKVVLVVGLCIFCFFSIAPAAEEPRRCDDGNKIDGDGCSSTGEIEPGWYTCAEVWDMYTSPIFSFCQGYNLNERNAEVLVDYDGDVASAYCTCCIAPGCE